MLDDVDEISREHCWIENSISCNPQKRNMLGVIFGKIRRKMKMKLLKLFRRRYFAKFRSRSSEDQYSSSPGSSQYPSFKDLAMDVKRSEIWEYKSEIKFFLGINIEESINVFIQKARHVSNNLAYAQAILVCGR